jgi:integrase
LPIEYHLEAFEEHLAAKNNTSSHVKQTVKRVEVYLTTMKRRSIDKIDPASVEGFIARLRREQKLSLQTCNHYIRAIKTFCNWLVKNNRLLRHPLLSVSLFNADTDRRHCRRPLDDTEFQYLLRAAEAGPTVEGMSGEDRFMFYVLAAWTGFRKGELGSVTLRHFKLDGEYPTLAISASYSKRRREDVQFLHPDVVSLFKTWIAKKNPKPDEILFPVSARTCGTERKTSKMVQCDLASAREVWINESNFLEEREAREESDYLKYVDSHGKYADFHGLRHTFITNLSRANIAPKTAQLLARHSNMKLTMQIYTHVAPVEQAAAIRALPGLGDLKKTK